MKGGRAGSAASQPIAPEGLTLDNVASGNNDFVIDDGKSSHTLTIDATRSAGSDR